MVSAFGFQIQSKWTTNAEQQLKVLLAYNIEPYRKLEPCRKNSRLRERTSCRMRKKHTNGELFPIYLRFCLVAIKLWCHLNNSQKQYSAIAIITNVCAHCPYLWSIYTTTGCCLCFFFSFKLTMICQRSIYFLGVATHVSLYSGL